MKTIEEKAYSHVDKIFSEIINKYQNAPWNEFRDALAQIYLAGATEALAGQWRSVEDVLPKADLNTELLIILPDSTYRKFDVAVWDGEDWFTTSGRHIRPTHWMPIPEPPKDESV